MPAAKKITGEVELIQKVSYERRTPREGVHTAAEKSLTSLVKETVINGERSAVIYSQFVYVSPAAAGAKIPRLVNDN